MSDDLKIRVPEWARNMYNRLLAKIDAGGGGGGDVTGVKGDAESTYRTGQVNLTAANIGALPDNTPIPSKTSDLTNDSGFLTSQTGVTGVKGNAENAYRHGNVNLTPANIGAVSTSNIANDLTTTAEGKVLDARQGKALKDTLDNIVLAPSSSIPIPASGSSARYNLAGLTSDHELVRWNFSASAENMPPVSLTWSTYNGYFTITNRAGTTSESIRPVFALPQAVAITSH